MNAGTKALLSKIRELDLTERQAAKRANCTPSAMHGYMTGRVPAGKKLFAVCDAFGIDPRSFYESAPRTKKSAKAAA